MVLCIVIVAVVPSSLLLLLCAFRWMIIDRPAEDKRDNKGTGKDVLSDYDLLTATDTQTQICSRGSTCEDLQRASNHTTPRPLTLLCPLCPQLVVPNGSKLQCSLTCMIV